MSRPTRAYPVLPVPDVGSALAFYMSLNGLELHWADYDNIAAIGAGDVTLFLK